VGELGSGETTIVRSLSGNNLIHLARSLSVVPPFGTKLTKPAIQKVRIDDIELTYERDYNFDAETATLTLNEDAEYNAAPMRNLGFDVTFDEGEVIVTGTGLSTLKPGWFIGIEGVAQM